VYVPLGKLKTERWVPVDSMVCQLIERIRSLRPPTAPNARRLILFRPRGRKISEMGKKGGKRRLKTMTAAERKALARKAGLASARARKKKAKQKAAGKG